MIGENSDEKRKITPKEYIESFMSRNGGYTREALRKLGVSYPPPSGWKSKLIKELENNFEKWDNRNQQEIALDLLHKHLGNDIFVLSRMEMIDDIVYAMIEYKTKYSG